MLLVGPDDPWRTACSRPRLMLANALLMRRVRTNVSPLVVHMQTTSVASQSGSDPDFLHRGSILASSAPWRRRMFFSAANAAAWAVISPVAT